MKPNSVGDNLAVPYQILEIDLEKPLPSVTLSPDETGLAILARLGDKIAAFDLRPLPKGTTLAPEETENLLRYWFGADILAAKIEVHLAQTQAGPSSPPTLTIAICTHNRPEGLKRLLESLSVSIQHADMAAPEIIVVDNASIGPATREAVDRFESARYVFEPKTGLNFARNTALAHASGDFIAFLDDDVTVDRAWLSGFFHAWRKNPEAGGFTGFVLPFTLQTEAQILFERNGGFRRGARPLHHGRTKLAKPIYPCGSGSLGAGCNMAFRTDLLRSLGGFDTALDTGAPLPGGGDLDIFYRVIRSGHPMTYEPQFAVYHEHRESLARLKKQYRSWGLGFMAYLVKNWRHDKPMRMRFAATVVWWFADRLRNLALAVLGRAAQKPSHAWAELIGGIVGLCGEYGRSKARVRAIEEAHK